MQEGRKDLFIYLFILLLYLLILNCGIDYWTGLDWFCTVKGDSLLDLSSWGLGWAVMVMVMVSSHAFH